MGRFGFWLGLYDVLAGNAWASLGRSTAKMKTLPGDAWASVGVPWVFASLPALLST